MNTYRITKDDLKNKEVLATGYKMFKHDWSTKYGNYSYADENGEVNIGDMFSVDGNIKECQWGLHFSANPLHCFNFYEPVQWNKFAKVNAYESIIEKEDKTVTQVIEIVEIYSFNEFIEIIKEYNINLNESYGVNGSDGVNRSYGVNESYGVNRSDGVNRSYGVNESYGVNWSYGVNRSNGVNESDGVNESYGVNGSYGVNESDGVNESYGVNGSYGVNESYGVNRSDGVNRSYGVNESYGVNWSYGVNGSDGVNRSYGVNGSYGIKNSVGVHKSIFCNDFSGKFGLFNKISEEKRINEVRENISWHPKFNNAFDLKNNKEWYETNIPNITSVTPKQAWSLMPREMEEYLRSLEEFDEKIFNTVTCRGDEK